MKTPKRQPTPIEANRGTQAEDLMADILKASRKRGKILYFNRPDFFVKPKNGSPYWIEVKGQAMFEGPPFDGHGLPAYQADNYQRLADDTGYRVMFIVIEDDVMYFNWLDELEEGRTFETSGSRGHPRRIYDIKNFNMVSLSNEAAS